jgi:hypothetical protein
MDIPSLIIVLFILLSLKLELSLDKLEDGTTIIWYTSISTGKRKYIKIY